MVVGVLLGLRAFAAGAAANGDGTSGRQGTGNDTRVRGTEPSPPAEKPGAETAAPPRWRFERMRPRDLAEALRARPVAWLVLSPLEWHGEAIAFGSDPLVGGAVAERAWEEVGGVLVPTLYLGAETEYKRWTERGLVTEWGMELLTREHNPGSLYVRPLTVELVLREYLEALQREGFHVCAVVTGHGGAEHVAAMRDVCRRDYGTMRVVFWDAASAPENAPSELRLAVIGHPAHANADEASLVGAIDPTLVDRAAFGVSGRDQKAGLKSENAAAIDFEKGAAVLKDNAQQLAQKVRAALNP